MGRIDALWWVASESSIPEHEVRLNPLFADDEDGAAATALLEMLRGTSKVEGPGQLMARENLDAESIVSTFEAVEQHIQTFTAPSPPLPSTEEELQSVASQVAAAISHGHSQARLSEWEEAVAKAEAWKSKQYQLLSAAGPVATKRCRELAALDPFVLAASLLFVREQDALPTKDAKEANTRDLDSLPAEVELPMQHSLETAESLGRSSSAMAGADISQIGGHAQDDNSQCDTGPCLLWWVDIAKSVSDAEPQPVDQGPAMEMADPASQAMLQLIQGAEDEDLDTGKREALSTLDFETIFAVLEAVEGHMRSTSITGKSGHAAAWLGPKVLDHIVRRVSTQVDVVQDLGMPGFLPFPDAGDAVDAGDADGRDARQASTSSLHSDTRDLLHWEHSMNAAFDWFSAANNLAPLLISAKKETDDNSTKEGCINIAAAMKFASMGGEDGLHRDALAMELLASDLVQGPDLFNRWPAYSRHVKNER